jgi:hypothetical protein
MHGEFWAEGGSIVVTVNDAMGEIPEFKKHSWDGAAGALGKLFPDASTLKVKGTVVMGVEPQPPAAPVLLIILGSLGDVPSALAESAPTKIAQHNAVSKIELFMMPPKRIE